ncbi:MAG: OB-fold domain-containing protein [Rhodobacterales bacterium]|nr:OB-fold domain-containing protein [Rhodobacterales bacterium]
MSEDGKDLPKRVAIRDDLLTKPLDDLDKVRLVGSRCRQCGETSLGERGRCPNCGSGDMETRELGTEGTLWTYTVVRNRPPGKYRGPDPFQPFCMGLVELPDGLRVNALVEGDVEEMEIGVPLRLRVFVHHENEAGQEVVGFAFARTDKP